MFLNLLKNPTIFFQGFQISAYVFSAFSDYLGRVRMDGETDRQMNRQIEGWME